MHSNVNRNGNMKTYGRDENKGKINLILYLILIGVSLGIAMENHKAIEKIGEVDVLKDNADHVTNNEVNEMKVEEGNMTNKEVNGTENNEVNGTKIEEGNMTKVDVNDDNGFKIDEEKITTGMDNYIEAVKCDTVNSRLRVSQCAQYELRNEKKIKFHLLQEIQKVTVPAVRCIIRRTVHSWYCGTSSHVHLAAPARIEESLLVTTEECSEMHVNRLFTMEGINIPVFTHRAQSHQFFVNGSIKYSDNLLWSLDPQCEGNGLFINQSLFVPNSFQDVNIKVQAQPITVTQYVDGCYHRDEYVGQNCLHNDLRLGKDRVTIINSTMKDKKFHLKYRTISIGEALIIKDSVQMGTNGEQGSQTMLMFNPHTAFGVELTGKKNFEDVLQDTVVYETNVPGILVWLTTAENPFFVKIQEEERDESLQLQLVLSFLKYKQMLLKSEDCYGEKTEISETVKMHRNRISRNMGEIEIVIPCETFLVKVTLEEAMPCYFHHLTVKVNGSLYGIAPFSRILKNVSGLMGVDCSENPVFLRMTDNRFIGNRGLGMEILTAIEDKTEDNEIYHLYDNQKNVNQFKEFGLEQVEEVYVRRLALDAQDFKIQVEENWFSNLYDRTVNFFSKIWHEIVSLIGLISVGVGVLIVVIFGCYIRQCTRIRKVESFDN